MGQRSWTKIVMPSFILQFSSFSALMDCFELMLAIFFVSFFLTGFYLCKCLLLSVIMSASKKGKKQNMSKDVEGLESQINYVCNCLGGMFLGIRRSALLLLVNKIIIEMTSLFLFIVFHLNLFYKGILQVLFCSVLILVNCSHGVCVFEKMIMLPVGILRASISINFTIVFVAVSVHVILNILRCNVT